MTIESLQEAAPAVSSGAPGALRGLAVAGFAAILLGAGACGSGVPDAEVSRELKTRLAASSGTATVAGERLIEPRTVEKFYRARQYRRAWPNAAAANHVLEAIDGAARDGLTPADYHRDAIARLAKPDAGERTAAIEADLELLMSDAVAGLVDHVRYGKVHPVSLDPKWNVDPRKDAPPIAEDLARISSAPDVGRAVEEARPHHFVYRGLTEALASLREVESQGGWAAIPPGKSIQENASDRRVPAMRARLRATGEYRAHAGADSLHYDRETEQAVTLFQRRHRLDDDGVVDNGTLEAMNVPVRTRIDQVRVNLERARWVLGGLADDFLLVNLPAYKAYLIRGGKNVWETRTQIGKEARQTPSFRADLKTVVFNPDWTVPPTILAEDVLDGMQKGENMLAKKHLVVLDDQGREVDPASIDWNSATPETFPYTLRQPPGENNALGRVKFLFPNPYSIYLHDTPSKELFDSESRSFSSGCIRIEHPLDLAERLLGWSRGQIDAALVGGETKNVAIDPPVPILIVYWTVSVGATGEVRYMRDLYDLDPAVLAALDAPAGGR